MLPPTLLIERSAPCLSVRRITSAASAPRVAMPASSPSARSLSSFSVEPEVPITFAPSALASCRLATPTPEETAVTSTQSSRFTRP
jgi:hypothetical protein